MTQALELTTPEDGTGTEQVQAERALESRCCKEMADQESEFLARGRRLVESILSMHELIGPLPPKQTDIQTDRGDEKKRKRGEMEGVGKREGEKKEKIHSLLPT